MKVASQPKNYCYKECGPVVTTGFQTQYQVCRSCKEEITELLAKKIKDNEADKKAKEAKQKAAEKDDQYGNTSWGL